MSGCVGRIAFDPGAFDEFQQGLAGVVKGLSDVGSEGTVDSGMALESLKLSADALGRSDLADVQNEIVERGRWVLHGGLQALEQTNKDLTDTRTLYQQADDAAAKVFDELHATFVDNPAARPSGGDGS
jgi:hypothetical protein